MAHQYLDESKQREIIQLIFENHNQQRSENGVNELQLNTELCKSAQWLAEHMSDEGFMSHVDKHRRGVGERVKELTGYNFIAIGENVAVGYTPQGIVKGWMDSPGHRKNILNPVYQHIGIGYYFKPFAVEKADPDNFDYMDYYCCVFGKSR